MYNDWWATSIKLLSQPGFLNKLKTYDKDKIKKKVIRKVAKYVAKPEFEPKRIMKASKAAGGLCSWVKALVDYDAVIKVVNPKKAALARLRRTSPGSWPSSRSSRSSCRSHRQDQRAQRRPAGQEGPLRQAGE